VENVGSLTPDAGDEVTTFGDFLGVINTGADGLGGGDVGDFSKNDLLLEVGGGERASKFELPGGELGRERDDDIGDGSVIVRVGWVPTGVLVVRGLGASRSEEGVPAGVDVTCSMCCTYRLSAVEEPVRG
jgi:hypothetical protein